MMCIFFCIFHRFLFKVIHLFSEKRELIEKKMQPYVPIWALGKVEIINKLSPIQQSRRVESRQVSSIYLPCENVIYLWCGSIFNLCSLSKQFLNPTHNGLIVGYCNTGCGVFKQGIQNQKDFLHKNQHILRKLLNFFVLSIY